jgi:hypothetical protein
MVARKTKGEGIKGISDKWELFARGHVSSPIPHLDFREFPTKKATKPQGFKPQNNFFFSKLTCALVFPQLRSCYLFMP